MDVNIGYPSRSLLVDNPEINSPIFSTGIGLLLLGYNTDKEKEREIKPKPEIIEEEVENEFEVSENLTEKKNSNPKGKFIEFFRDSIANLFDEKGSEM